MLHDDRALIEARLESLREEKKATAELHDRLDSYLAPDYRSRKMIDHWDTYIDNGGYATEDMYMNFRYATERTRLESNRIASWVLADHIPMRKVDMNTTMFGDILKRPRAKTNDRLNGEDDAADSSNAWDNIVNGAYRSIEIHGHWKLPVLAPSSLVASLKAKVERQLAAGPGQAEIDKTIAGAEGAKLAHWVYSNQAGTFEEMYQLASDPLIYSIAQKYLGVPPIFNTPVSVLSGPVHVKQSKEMEGTGQLYHYDMHRLKFVKMFIYLTDVDDGAGPHTLIRGTHKNRPEPLWTDRRYTDEEMLLYGVKKDEVNITGKAGTVFFVDTSAYHKGAHPDKSYRIMAQVQFTNSLFGKPLKPVEHKLELLQSKESQTLHKTAALVRKYAALRGPRFMQNFI